MGAPGLKPLERLAKRLLALLAVLLFARPFRASRTRARLHTPGRKRVLVVRLDNRVGEALLTTPLVDALADAGHEVHLLVHPKMRRVLDGHPHLTRLWNFEKSLAVLRALRAERFDVVINAGNWDEPAVTSALVSRLVGPSSAVLGPATWPVGALMDLAVAAKAGSRSEAVQRRWLASPLLAVGDGPARLSFRPTTPVAWINPPYAVINPGGRLGWRRVAPERFATAARALLERGVTPLVTWGPGEEALVDDVVRLAPGAVRAPPTDLDALASLMRGAQLTVCNNTGPMHLSVAVGCPTVALFLHMDLDRWGHAFAPHRMLDLTGAADPDALVREALR